MRPMLIVFAVLLVLGLIGGCLAVALNMGGEVDRSSPKATVTAAIKAIPSRDIDRVTQYFTPAPSGQMAHRLRNLYADFDKLAIENVFVYIVYEEGINARVQASYDLVMTAKGHENTQHRDVRVKLINNDGVWYINEAF